MQERIQSVIENYDSLLKATNDDGEFVIIAEVDSGGSYEEYKECLGVNKKGELIWCYLSGCSCSGGNSNEVVTDVTAKIFSIKRDQNSEEFYNANKCEPYSARYTSY